MAYFDDPTDEPVSDWNSRTRVMVSAVAAGLAILVGAWWMLRPTPPAARQPVPSSPPQADRGPAPSAPATGVTPSVPETARREPAREARARPRADAPAGAAVPVDTLTPAPPARELSIEVDVPGAMVFLDCKYLGTAPVKTTDVTPGTHQVNASAEGFDGVAQSVNVTDSGSTSITLRLREVRLNESVEVVHKHGMGSCQGRLTADLTGVKYVPTSGGDAFTLPLDMIEGFEVDYLKKNLRLKQRGGKTWNFESPTGSADPLFVFHRDVEKARTKLAAAR